MTVALDSYYTIGKVHLYCQDYVFQGWKPVPHVILADGCSASPNSDVGARLLVLNARRELERYAKIPRDGPELAIQHWDLGRQIVLRAARQAQELDLNPEVLDATLLVAWCDGATVYVHLYGDGCIATRRADGELALIEVEYAENAPYYLSYLLEPDRQVLYQGAVGNPEAAQTIHYRSQAADVSTRQKRFDTPVAFSFDLATFPTVAVATDGLHSFISAETGQQVDLLEVAQAMFDFGDLQGTFVMDRLQNTLIEFGNRLLFNLDDLSVGAFVKVA
ncbi:MAG: protein phosphatase 2C domain-containing protein [Candidatus Competibacteraceae bacterium]|nr:protein phosphatase 2C domain-containing protein [Candidatus Competibacteraceae bacterium]MBK7983724.1 protein phosphatase 2C domain-containing protein [Candidatus Competibacteraceae bacterium]MBK8897734.1 protein phosphatase 2C domain-containing protein [Candidatus Competibacteraceae bacterium]MBK8961539.1 protein phosphatase 2C domain-containing protein [Candidatus Competibacteraceae bacterium]MBK9950765.1 protein phosphatase 2C domain-containing protein [Candidatus Competibacteraceae bact